MAEHSGGSSAEERRGEVPGIRKGGNREKEGRLGRSVKERRTETGRDLEG